MSQIVHTYPVNDLIDHDLEGDDCPCGPTSEPVKAEDGSVGWVVLHHSLDGRERFERPRLHDLDDVLAEFGIDLDDDPTTDPDHPQE